MYEINRDILQWKKENKKKILNLLFTPFNADCLCLWRIGAHEFCSQLYHPNIISMLHAIKWIYVWYNRVMFSYYIPCFQKERISASRSLFYPHTFIRKCEGRLQLWLVDGIVPVFFLLLFLIYKELEGFWFTFMFSEEVYFYPFCS